MLRIFRGINFVVEDGLDVCYPGDGVAVGVLVAFELWGWTGGVLGPGLPGGRVEVLISGVALGRGFYSRGRRR